MDAPEHCDEVMELEIDQNKGDRGVKAPSMDEDGEIKDYIMDIEGSEEEILAKQSEYDSEDEDVNPALQIPSEVLVQIFARLSQKDLIRCRSVCRKWRHVVDFHMDFSVIVHDGKTDLERIFQIRIKDCLVTRLTEDAAILQFPSLLRRLRLWGPITGRNFRRIMRQTVENEELSLTRFALGYDKLLNTEILPGFKKLRNLELLGYSCKDESQTIVHNTIRIFSYEMPFLQKLFVNFNCYTESLDSIFTAFFDFLVRHSRTIENLNVSLIPMFRASQENRNSVSAMSRIPPEIQERLGNIQLKLLRITTATLDFSSWGSLMSHQKNLVDFRVRWTPMGFETLHINGIPWIMYQAPIIQSAETLTCVDLKGMTLVSDESRNTLPFDCNIFRHALKIRRLVLHRSPDDTRRNVEPNDAPTMINLFNIPCTVEDLEIVRFRCHSTDLQGLIDSLELLKNVALLRTGTVPGMGVHGGIVKSITERPHIKIMSITTFNYCDKAENKKFDELKSTFGMSEVDEHLYYDFDRYRNGEPQPKPASRSCAPAPSPSSSRCFDSPPMDRRRRIFPGSMRFREYRRLSCRTRMIRPQNLNGHGVAEALDNEPNVHRANPMCPERGLYDYILDSRMSHYNDVCGRLDLEYPSSDATLGPPRRCLRYRIRRYSGDF